MITSRPYLLNFLLGTGNKVLINVGLNIAMFVGRFAHIQLIYFYSQKFTNVLYHIAQNFGSS